MWNDTDIPLAHLFTLRCYGTWLHGDERGSIDRFHNIFGAPFIAPNQNWRLHNVRLLDGDPVTLDLVRRQSIKKSIVETCAIRHWHLYAANVRTNHVHIVASIGTASARQALGALKANATRQMRDDGCWREFQSAWAAKGSRRCLWNEQNVARAVEYVLCEQGGDLDDFENS